MNRDATDLAGVRHETFETLGSTNAEALARARAGECEPLWISAAGQTDGRGRRGSAWASPRGNLYATLLLCEPSLPAFAPQLSFVAALALHDAVASVVQKRSLSLTLKWPNDLLLDRRKIAGLLIEAESQPAFSVAVGFGVNCKVHPDDTAFPATDLRAHDVAVEPRALMGALAATMNKRLSQWRAGAGFASIRADWLGRAAGIGESIKVRLPERQLAGIFHGIDQAGQLLLKTAGNKTETIGAGDVFALGH